MEANMESIKTAQEKFAELIQSEFERIERMKADKEVTDFSKLDKIFIGVLPGDGIGPIIMEQAVRVLEGIEDIAICRLTASDVVRHALVQKIVAAYDKFEQERIPASAPRNHPERGKGHGSQDRRHV